MMKLNVIYVFQKKRLRKYFNLQAHDLVAKLTQIDFFVQCSEYLSHKILCFWKMANCVARAI